MSRQHFKPLGVTLIELLVGVAILATILALGLPSFRDWIVTQRVKAIGAELVTDLQMARSESISRGSPIRVSFGSSSSETCYTVHLAANPTTLACDCTKPIGTACSGLFLTELKTVKVESGTGVTLTSNNSQVYNANAAFNVAATPMEVLISDGGSKSVKVTSSSLVQRPSMCTPSGSTVAGIKQCP